MMRLNQTSATTTALVSLKAIRQTKNSRLTQVPSSNQRQLGNMLEDFVFAHKWVDDLRDPLFTFSMHGGEQLYGFYFLSIPFWIQLLAIIFAEAMFATVVAMLFYQTVVRNQGTQKAYLIGYSFFLPFWMFAPKFAVEQLAIENKIFRFCICVITPTMSIFRTTEAIHGFAPDYVVGSMADYVLYFSSPMYLTYDKKTSTYVKASIGRITGHLGRFIGFCFLTGAYQSLFSLFPAQFPALGTDEAVNVIGANWFTWQTALDPATWRDSALYALLFQLYLTTFGEGLVFATTLVTRRQTMMLMDNPLFESKSPSDFWGRRWNLLIHTGLKNGVYKPVRQQGGSKPLAVLAAFVASGLFHEWLLPSVFFDYPNTHGTTLVFFAWQAALVSMEAVIGHWTVFQHISKNVPAVFRTILVILSGIPLGHWFCESYVASNFFRQGQVTWPLILPVER